jgi:hypothetical protein
MGYTTTYSLSWQDLKHVGVPQDKSVAAALADLATLPNQDVAKSIAEKAGLKLRTLDEWVAKLITEDEDADYALEPDGNTKESCKWYDWQKSLIAFSVATPGVLFTLDGEGEESGDIWKAYALDGKIQIAKAEIIIAGFNEAALA